MASKEVHHRHCRPRPHQNQSQCVSVAHEGVHTATGPASDPGEVCGGAPPDADDVTAVGVVRSPVAPPFGCLLGVILRLEDAKAPEGGCLGVPPDGAKGPNEAEVLVCVAGSGGGTLDALALSSSAGCLA